MPPSPNQLQPTGRQRLAALLPRLKQTVPRVLCQRYFLLPTGQPALENGRPNEGGYGSVKRPPHPCSRSRKTSLTTPPVGLILARSSKPCWHIGRLLKPTMVSPKVSPDGALGASPHGAGRGVSADSPKVTASRVTRSAKLATMPGVCGGRFSARTMGYPFAEHD
jgi:hypothetical protein